MVPIKRCIYKRIHMGIPFSSNTATEGSVFSFHSCLRFVQNLQIAGIPATGGFPGRTQTGSTTPTTQKATVRDTFFLSAWYIRVEHLLPDVWRTVRSLQPDQKQPTNRQRIWCLCWRLVVDLFLASTSRLRSPIQLTVHCRCVDTAFINLTHNNCWFSWDPLWWFQKL